MFYLPRYLDFFTEYFGERYINHKLLWGRVVYFEKCGMEQVDISTKFVGLRLPSPLIASSSGMTSNVERLVSMEMAGIGAVVLKSVFEEQIRREVERLMQDDIHPEAHDYLSEFSMQRALDESIGLIDQAKRHLSIPVIASICCSHDGQWASFARKFQNAGADAIELNVYILPTNPFLESLVFEQHYFDIVRHVRSEISIPLIVKIGSAFTNLPAFVDQLRGYGADAVTIFNRFYSPDINLRSLQFTSAPIYGTASDFYPVLRWTGLLRSLSSGKPMQISASSGVYRGADAVKLLLVGANSVQLCSTLYKNGFAVIGEINDCIKEWMSQNSFSALSQWNGMLSYADEPNPERYERVQFMKYYKSEF